MIPIKHFFQTPYMRAKKYHSAASGLKCYKAIFRITSWIVSRECSQKFANKLLARKNSFEVLDKTALKSQEAIIKA